MRTVFRPDLHAELVARLGTLRLDAPRRWGRMTAHQAVCHLSDSFKGILQDRPITGRRVGVRRRIQRIVAFTLPVPWPKGFATSREVDAEKDGTRPASFAADVAELESLLRRFVASDGRGLEPHYAWGAMSRGEWGRYAYRHVDHHLRQFGA